MTQHLHRCNPYAVTQAHLGTHQHQDERKKLLDTQLAYAVFAGGLKFNSFEGNRNPWLRKAFELNNPGYTPPTRHQLAGEFLEKVYAKVKGKVLNILKHQDFLNFSTDESEDNNGHRLANLSVVIPGLGSFHLISQDIKSTRFTA